MGHSVSRVEVKSKVKSAAVGRKPNSVPLRETIIPLVPALLTGSSDLPGNFGRAVLSSALARNTRTSANIVSLFGLAPCGVLPAICLTADAVRSYRTFSPLPFDSAPYARLAQGGIFSVPLVLQVALTGRYPAHCPSEFGLSSPPCAFGAQRGDHLPTATVSIVLHSAAEAGR